MRSDNQPIRDLQNQCAGEQRGDEQRDLSPREADLGAEYRAHPRLGGVDATEQKDADGPQRRGPEELAE